MEKVEVVALHRREDVIFYILHAKYFTALYITNFVYYSSSQCIPSISFANESLLYSEDSC